MTDEAKPVAADGLPDDGWLIHKAGRGWYRTNAQGYTSSPADADRYSRANALKYSHPNGPDGPRDGLSIKHESEVPGAVSTRPTPPADSAMVEALMLSAHLKRLADAYTCDPSRYYRAELLGKFVAENLPAIYSALKAAEQTKPRAATTPVRAAPAVGIAGNTAMAAALSANAAKLAELDREIEALRGDVGRRDILIAEMIGKAAISVSLGGGEMWSRFNDEAIQGRAALGSAKS